MTVRLDIGGARKEREQEQAAGIEIIDHEDRAARKGNGEAPALPEINTIDFASLPDVEPPARRFRIDQWMPDTLNSMYGPGGIGKSLLAQQAATCIVAGLDFMGAKVEQAPVLGLFAEDDDDELIRRQWRINRALGLTNRQIADLHIQGRMGLDNVLASFPMTGPVVAGLYDATIRKAKERDAKVVMLDNRAQMLLVAENDRGQATFAGNLCAGIAREINGAVLLLGHVAKADGSEYSGSTAWDAVTRSRWWLRRAEQKEDAEPELILDRAKSNYAPPDSLRLIWRDGIMRPSDERHMTDADRLERKVRQGAACQAFLDALDVLTAQGRPVSHSAHARATFAPRFMQTNALVDGFTVGEIAAAMNALFADGRIEANAPVVKGSDRKWRTGIARSVRDSLE